METRMAAMAEEWTAAAVHLCGGISAMAAVRDHYATRIASMSAST